MYITYPSVRSNSVKIHPVLFDFFFDEPILPFYQTTDSRQQPSSPFLFCLLSHKKAYFEHKGQRTRVWNLQSPLVYTSPFQKIKQTSTASKQLIPNFVVNASYDLSTNHKIMSVKSILLSVALEQFAPFLIGTSSNKKYFTQSHATVTIQCRRHHYQVNYVHGKKNPQESHCHDSN